MDDFPHRAFRMKKLGGSSDESDANSTPHQVDADGTPTCDLDFERWSELPTHLLEKAQRWSQVHAPLPDAFESYGLVESRGRLFMLGRQEEESPAGKRVCVMQLQLQRARWEEVDRMPAGLLTEFLRDAAHDAYLRCIGHSELVLISMFGRSMPQLLYHVGRKAWRRLSRCPVPDHRMVDGFSFEPRLDAAV